MAVIEYRIRAALHIPLETQVFVFCGKKLAKNREELSDEKMIRLVLFGGRRLKFEDCFRASQRRRVTVRMLGEKTPEKNAIFELREWDTILGLKLAIAREHENIDHEDLIVYEKTWDHQLPGMRELDDTFAFFNGVKGDLYLRHIGRSIVDFVP